MPDTRKYAIYSRKSKFTGKGESIENQVEICRRELIRRYGITDEEILVFEDEGFSGKNTKRPMFQKMMSQCREKRIQVVICYRLDRISRNTSDFLKTYEELKDCGVTFQSVHDNIDDSSAFGKAMMMISSVFAELERNIIAERITDNMHELAKDGRWLGGNTPTGYKSAETVGSVTVDGRTRTARMLEQVPQEIETVVLIFDKFIELGSLTKLETYLLNNGVKTKIGNDFSRFALKTILRNPVYMINDSDAYKTLTARHIGVFSEESDFDGQHAVIAYNKTLQTDGKSMKRKDESEWIAAVGRHKGVITGRRWAEVQELLDKNTDKAYRKPRSNVALLTGVLFCADCGSYMRPKLSQRTNSEGECIYDYLCELKEKSRRGKCDMKRINGNLLDKLVCEELKKLSADGGELRKRVAEYRNSIDSTSKTQRSELDGLVKQKDRLEKERANLISALAMAGGTAAAGDILERINEYHGKITELEKHITEYRSLINKGELDDVGLELLAEQLADFSKLIDEASVEEKRRLIRSVVKRVEWDGEDIHLFLIGDDTSENGAEKRGIGVQHSEPQCECSK